MRQKKYWMETYGCQMNKAEAEALKIKLQEAGYAAGSDSRDADLVVLNTCAVRKTAEDRIWGRLGYFKRLKEEQDFCLAVIGCMSERIRDEMKRRFPEIDIALGTFEKESLVHLIKTRGRSAGSVVETAGRGYHFAKMHSTDPFKAFLPIMNGCNNFCSYCIVPYVRGPEISRKPAEILEELRTLEDRGVREVTLLGQNVNSYRYRDGKKEIRFPDLLKKIAGYANRIRWVRFMTSHPKDCSVELIDAVASSRIFCRHIHLPVQHGSDRILSLMNRGYTRQDYLSLVRMIKNKVSDVSMTTDILIGFPSEDEKDFARTKELMEAVGFDDAFTYYYNPREGTKAFSLNDDVVTEEKLRRLKEIIELNQKIKLQRKKDRLSATVDVLVESVSKKQPDELLGRTEHDDMVVFAGPRTLIGEFVKVRLQSVNGTTFRGVNAH